MVSSFIPFLFCAILQLEDEDDDFLWSGRTSEKSLREAFGCPSGDCPEVRLSV